MTIGRILLDSNCAIAVIAKLPLAEDLLAENDAYLPVTAIGELYYGAYNSARREENLQRARSFAQTVTVLYCDDVTAEFYAKVRSQLKKIGRPIPQNDIWIAAIALQYDLPIASKDKHFDSIEGLERIEW